MAQNILKQCRINEQDYLPQPNHPKQSIFDNLFKIGKFNEERNPIDASLSIGAKYLLPLLILSNSLPFNEHNSYLLAMQQLLNYSIIYYPLIIFNKFLIVVTLVALYRQIFLLSSLVQEVIKIFRSKLRLLIEIDFHVSMLLLSSSILPNLPNAILSYALYNFSCIYLENYINKDDYFYCSSCKASFFGRLLMTIGYILNALINFGSNKGLVEIFILIFTACMWLWYHHFGYKLYPQLMVKRGMTGFISLLIAANLLLLEKNFIGGSTQLGAFLIRTTLSFGLVSFCLQQCSNMTFKAVQQSPNLLEIKDVLNHLFVNQSPMEQIIFLYGKIQIHRDRCENLHCELHSFDLFNQKISLHQEQWGIKNILKSYFRCLYESKMINKDQHSGLLDYLQYLFSQNSCNPFKMSLILSQINLSNLDIFDRASLYDLKSNVQKLFKNQMKELYDGKLHFEDNIDFDNSCLNLQQMIFFLVKSNMRIYQHLEQSEIDLNIVFERIRINLSVEKDLIKCWGKISRNMQYHRSISVIYLYYKQLIKNQRITRKDLLFIQPGQNVRSDAIYNFNPKIYDTSILFHKETIIFTCYLHEKKLLFKDFNYNFQNILQYSKEELVSASIDHIFTEQLAKVHQDSFQSWLHGNLKSTYSQAQFSIKDTECIAKDKCIVPVFKYFKAYLNSDSDLEFICLLKVNKKLVNTTENMDYLQAERSQPLQMLENEGNEPEKSFLYRSLDMQLSNEHAIFIKDKEFEPNSESWDIFQFKAIIFAFCFLISSSLVIFHLATVEDSIILQQYAKQYITFMQCYRIPMILGNNYLQSIMQVGNLTKIATQITQLSNTFAALQSSPIVIETLYNPSINVITNYSPYSNDYLIANRSLQFDSIQLFYMISSSIASLRAPVNKTSLDFLTFDQLITPSYDDMINGTKHKFHDSFIDYISHILSTHLTIEVIQIILCIVFFTLIIFKIRAFMKKMKLISDAIVYFKNEDLDNILSYWKNSRLIFKELFQNFKNEHAGNVPNMRSTTLKKREQRVQQYLNRVNKNIRQSKHFKNFWTITVLEVLIGTLLLMGCLSVTEFSRTDKFNYLIYFEQQGYLFLKYFPTATITGYGCLSKYRSVHFPNETGFDYSRFNPSLEAMELVGQFTYIPQVQENNSEYFQKQRNYFFGNPCIFNPKVISAIGVSQATCGTIIDGSFTRGLTTYMRVASQRARDFMNGEKDMNSSQLGEFSTSVSVLSAYILDAITTWGTEFHSLLDMLIQQQTILTLVNFAVLGAVVLIIFVFLFIGFLEREYEFYRYMFMKMIPEYTLKTDKVARQTFINFNILE